MRQCRRGVQVLWTAPARSHHQPLGAELWVDLRQDSASCFWELDAEAEGRCGDSGVCVLLGLDPMAWTGAWAEGPKLLKVPGQTRPPSWLPKFGPVPGRLLAGWD